MNATKYRKLILSENWGNNNFIMIKQKVNVPKCFPCPYSINFQIAHPKILSGEAYWITHNELCIGYYLDTNGNIFRPIFSHKRQIMLNIVQYGGEEEGQEYSISNPNLKYARKKYLVGLIEFELMQLKKKIPMDCVNIILSFIHKHL